MKNDVYPCKPQFYYIKVGLRGSKLYRRVFVMLLGLSGTCVFPSLRVVDQACSDSSTNGTQSDIGKHTQVVIF